MTSSLAAFQDDFSAALRGDPTGTAVASLVAQPAFAIYRNTTRRGCIDALEANFPAVVCLVGRDWFRSAAADYVNACPPDDARLLYYGRTFPDFLARFESIHALPYLAGVASLDRLWTEAYVAADVMPLPSEALSPLSPTELGRWHPHLHPATRWHTSDLPIHTIWQASRTGTVVDGNLEWKAEDTLIVRVNGRVRTMQVERATCTLLDAFHTGRNLSAATDFVMAAHPHATLESHLIPLLAAGAFAAVPA